MEREQSSCRTVARIWEIYEEMQEIVYVLELEAHELVYMNRHAREVYGKKKYISLIRYAYNKVMPCIL